MNVLIAEDDEKMSKIMTLYFKKAGYTVNTVFNGGDAVSYMAEHPVDLLLLDWMMPDKNGIEVCREVRLLNMPVKIIMITAKTTPESELLGLTVGADDYIKKPFDMDVLLLRVKKICHLENVLSYQDLSLNIDTSEVTKNNIPLDLTKKEFTLLSFFMSHPKIILSREKLLNHVWGMDYFGDTRTVDTHVRRLRKKIGEEYIQTKVGMGYVLGESND